jgi:hypothetical protein
MRVALQNGKGSKRRFNGRTGVVTDNRPNGGGWVSVALNSDTLVKWRNRAWCEINSGTGPATATSAATARKLSQRHIQWAMGFLDVSDLTRIASTCRVWLHAALASAKGAPGALKLSAASGASAIARHGAFSQTFGMDGFLSEARFVALKLVSIPYMTMTPLTWDGGVMPLCTSVKGLDACFTMPYAYYMCNPQTQETHEAAARVIVNSIGQSLANSLGCLRIRFDVCEESLQSLLSLKTLQYLDLCLLRDRYDPRQLCSTLESMLSELPNLKTFTLSTVYFHTPMELRLESTSLEYFEAIREKTIRVTSILCPKMKKLRVVSCGGGHRGLSIPSGLSLAIGCPNLQFLECDQLLSVHGFNQLQQCRHLKLVDVAVDADRESAEAGADCSSARLDFPELVVLTMTLWQGSLFPVIAAVDCPSLCFARFKRHGHRYLQPGEESNPSGTQDICMATILHGSPSLEVLDVVKHLTNDSVNGPSNSMWCRELHRGSAHIQMWDEPARIVFSSRGIATCVACGRAPCVSPDDCKDLCICKTLRQDVYRRLRSKCNRLLELPSGVDGRQGGGGEGTGRPDFCHFS